MSAAKWSRLWPGGATNPAAFTAFSSLRVGRTPFGAIANKPTNNSEKSARMLACARQDHNRCKSYFCCNSQEHTIWRRQTRMRGMPDAMHHIPRRAEGKKERGICRGRSLCILKVPDPDHSTKSKGNNPFPGYCHSIPQALDVNRNLFLSRLELFPF